MKKSKYQLFNFFVLLVFHAMFTAVVYAGDTVTMDLSDGTEVEVRVFPGDGDALLLGFACDEGASINEERTAEALSERGLEVWMPDMLGAYMLPKLRTSLEEIPAEDIVALVEQAHKMSGKKVYLIASGPDTELILRGAAEWESSHEEDSETLAGALLMFPRLNKGEPEPGSEPTYVDAVGKTHLPIMVLEGQRTPNSWGLEHFTTALSASGSEVSSRVIPSVRGYFFKRDDANEPEELVTSQMSGLIKASLLFLDGAKK